MLKVIKIYRKYREVTYRAVKFKSWGINLIEKRLKLGLLVRLLLEAEWLSLLL